MACQRESYSQCLDKHPFQCYILIMMSDPYSKMTDEDHDDMRAWLDDLKSKLDTNELIHDDEGFRPCQCEDRPCCGH